MPRTKEIQVYKVQELEGKARDRALETLAEANTDGEWWDYTYDDAKQIGLRLGIEIDDISFSGFSSQGDGASFTGTYKPVADPLTSLREHANDPELDRIAERLAAVTERNGLEFEAAITRDRSNYAHSGTVEVETYDMVVESDSGNRGELAETLREFMDWIYRQLEAEYEYQTSEAACIESADANDYEFDAHGDLA